MSTPSITGCYFERMNEAIRFSEAKRVRVAELGKEIGDKARAELTRDYAAKPGSPIPSESMLSTVADNAIEKDARWKTAVGDEQWGQRLTTMYALAELVIATRENTQVLKAIHSQQQTQIVDQRRLLAEQRTTNELLKTLVGQLSVPTERSDPPVPPQRGFRGPAFDEPI